MEGTWAPQEWHEARLLWRKGRKPEMQYLHLQYFYLQYLHLQYFHLKYLHLQYNMIKWILIKIDLTWWSINWYDLRFNIYMRVKLEKLIFNSNQWYDAMYRRLIWLHTQLQNQYNFQTEFQMTRTDNSTIFIGPSCLSYLLFNIQILTFTYRSLWMQI